MNAFSLALALTIALATGVPYRPLVADLGDHRFMVRENASKLLFELGVEGHPVEHELEKATRTLDAETRWRAVAILERLDDERTKRRLAEEERLAAIRGRYERGLGELADQLFPYYPFLDSLWYNREKRDFSADPDLKARFEARYMNGGTRIFTATEIGDGRLVPRVEQKNWNTASKRLAMDALNNGVSPLTINLLFHVMKVNDNLYLGKTLEPAETPVPEDLPLPEEKNGP